MTYIEPISIRYDVYSIKKAVSLLNESFSHLFSFLLHIPTMSTPTPPRYASLQKNRTLVHPTLPQDDKKTPSNFSFVVCADTQIGITSQNSEWKTELEYSRQAIAHLNQLRPRPLFCCVCGDLVDMTSSIFANKDGWTEAECNRVQDQQNKDWKRTWDDVHPDIALVCVCGNHDVGNRPTRADIERFTSAFGDDYLAFWVSPTLNSLCKSSASSLLTSHCQAYRTYNIVVNSNLFSDPSGAFDLYEEQLEWLEDRLKYAQSQQASHIFVFGHHPWFLYHDDETAEDLKGQECPFPIEWGPPPANGPTGFPDSYFPIPLERRRKVLQLFEQYKVTAAFSGHFHQNLISKSSFGMDMIITSSLSLVFESTGIPKDFDEPRNKRGLRVVNVQDDGTFQHRFVSLA